MSAKLIDWFDERAKRLGLRDVTDTSKFFNNSLTPVQRLELAYTRESLARFAKLQRQFYQQKLD